jgi:hypothetical protein
MNTETSEVYQDYDKKALKRIYYKTRYDEEPGFREKEIARNIKVVKEKYANCPEYRERIKAQALARYYRLKEQKAQ